MPTRDQLETALRNAHKAGDAAAATQLAKALKGMGPEDSMLDNALDVAGEFAAGVNRSVMWPIDTAISAVNMVPGVDLPSSRDLPGADGNFMEPGMARSAVRAFGETAPIAGAGVQVAGRNLASPSGAIAEFVGAGSTAPVAASAQMVADGIANPSTNAQRKVALLSDSSHPSRAGYKLNEVGRPVKDQAQSAAQGAGVSDDLIALVSSASPQERRQMLQMVDAVGQADPVLRSQNSPRMALADSLGERVKGLLSANSEAVKAQRKAINDLRGVRLGADDLQALNEGPMRDLQDSLADLNISFDPSKGDLSFQGSVFQTAPEAQGKIREALNYLYSNAPRSAHDLHIAKDAINELANWTSQTLGAKSKANSVVKGIRSSLNNYLRELPSASDYARANDALSETIPVIDELNRLLGRNTDIRSEAAGSGLARLSRRLLSNAQSTEAVDSVLQDLARYGDGEDVWRQNVFLERLDGTFGSQQTRGLQGEVNKGVELALQAVQGDQRGVTSRVMDYASSAFQKSPEEQKKAQLAALRKLIVGSLEP